MLPGAWSDRWTNFGSIDLCLVIMPLPAALRRWRARQQEAIDAWIGDAHLVPGPPTLVILLRTFGAECNDTDRPRGRKNEERHCRTV